MNPRINSQFIFGFVSAILALGAITLAAYTAEWMRHNPQPQTLADFVKAPRFSIADAFVLVAVLMIIGVLMLAPRVIRA